CASIDICYSHRLRRCHKVILLHCRPPILRLRNAWVSSSGRTRSFTCSAINRYACSHKLRQRSPPKPALRCLGWNQNDGDASPRSHRRSGRKCHSSSDSPSHPHYRHPTENLLDLSLAKALPQPNRTTEPITSSASPH